jgi:hypothetical protein
MLPSRTGRRRKLPPQDQVLNPLRRKVLRRRIPAGEIGFGLLFLALLAAAGGWVAAQRDNFDPAERDLSFESLAAASVEDTLYRTPVLRWREPGAEAPGAAEPDLGIFPAALLDGGWQLDGRAESYEPGNVYEKINGAADQYIRFGFERLHFVTLVRGADLLFVELYDQGSFQNALGIYSEQKDPEQAVERRGEMELYRTPAGVIGRYERYYFKAAGNSDAPAVREKASEIAAALLALPVSAAATDEPLPLRVLVRRLGLPTEALEYVKTDAFQYDFAQDFWFGRLPDDWDVRAFLHAGADPEAARRLLALLVAEQRHEHRAVEQDDQGALLQHDVLETWFALRLHGSVVYGVEGAPDRAGAEALLGRLQEGLSLEAQADPAP